MENLEKQIAEILQQRRADAFERAARDYETAKRDEVFARLDFDTRELTLKTSFVRSQGNPDEAGEKKLARLEKQRDAWLKERGLSIHPVFTCPVCKDTGFNEDGTRCECAKNLLNELIKTRSRGTLPPFTFEQNDIDSFDCRQRETLNKAYSLFKKFAEDFPDTPVKSLIISGEVGSGKTCLMAAVGNALADRGFTVLFTTAFMFNKKLLEYHVSDLQTKANILDEFLDADMLMIDDLGTEQIYKNVTLEYMYDIFDSRFAQGKSVMITTNLESDEISDRYGERIFSRLFNKRYCSYKRLMGDDLRLAGSKKATDD